MGGLHAKLAPSAASRWLACPGSVRLSEGLTDTSSPAALEGTFAHEIAAAALESGEPAGHFLGVDDPGGFVVDDDMVAHLNTYIDAVEACHVKEQGKLHIETKVRVPACRDLVYGTADAVVVGNDGFSIDVFDLKYGAGIKVDVENNAQLRLYAIGALARFAPKAAIVRIHVVQPRHYQGGHTTETLMVEELHKYHNDVIVPGVTKTLAEDAPVDPGEHCRFCPARSSCPVLRETALAAAQHVFEDTSLQRVRVDPQPSPSRLSSEEIATALRAFPALETWMKMLRSHAYERANAGDMPPGFKLVEKVGNRVWKDEDTARATLSEAGCYPYTDPKLVSPAQAEKKVGKDLVRDLAEKPVTGTVLVADSDKRPALNRGDVFLT